MKIYYALWADLINYEKIKNGGVKDWKWRTFGHMVMLHSYNIMTCLSAILFFTGYNLNARIVELLSVTSSELLNKAIWGTVTLFIPSGIVIYFSIFYKKKYNRILKNYKFRNGKLLIIYFILSLILLLGFSLLNKFM